MVIAAAADVIESVNMAATAVRPHRTAPGRAVGGEFAATISTLDGRFITAGLAIIEDDGAAWRATLRALNRPGQVATAYFADGVRDVMLRLDDGRRAQARISGTSFIAAAERVCALAGSEPLG